MVNSGWGLTLGILLSPIDRGAEQRRSPQKKPGVGIRELVRHYPANNWSISFCLFSSKAFCTIIEYDETQDTNKPLSKLIITIQTLAVVYFVSC